jgi:hypothetical protein
MSKELVRKCRICATIIKGHNRIYCRPCADERHKQQAKARSVITYQEQKLRAKAVTRKKSALMTDSEQVEINLTVDRIGGKYARINCTDHHARMLTRGFSWLMR